MYRGSVTTDLIRGSVLSVPPLARDANLAPAAGEIARLADHLAAGGVTTLMYGGNALFYHVGVSDYGALLDTLQECAPANAWVIPSVGPDYGKMLDQLAIVRDKPFPTAMVLPSTFPVTPEGIADGLRRAADALGRPIIAYVKNEGTLAARDAAALLREGAACAIKYAIVREDPSRDAYLDALLDAAGSAERIISGIGERPVIAHFAKGLRAFTSGSVCIAPALSNAIREALLAGDTDRAGAICEHFIALEDLRDGISPIRVLHEAVDQAGIAATGPMLPLMSRLGADEAARVRDVARALYARNTPTREAAE